KRKGLGARRDAVRQYLPSHDGDDRSELLFDFEEVGFGEAVIADLVGELRVLAHHFDPSAGQRLAAAFFVLGEPDTPVGLVSRSIQLRPPRREEMSSSAASKGSRRACSPAS